MESDKFDALARRAIGDSSRRGVLRAGLGALAASALALARLRGAEETEAKNKHHGPHHKRNSGNSNKRKRQIVICFRDETLTTTRGKFQDGNFQGATEGACQCQAPTPITCGVGCCANEFPQCCQGRTGGGGPGENFETVCAPNTSRCCPVNQGGGVCDSPNNQCCPPNNFGSRGYCAPVDAGCCNTQQGGGFCPAPFNKCCPISAPFLPGGGCCRPTQLCCTAPGTPAGAAAVAAGCLAGQACNFGGCCSSDVATAGGAEGVSKSAGVERIRYSR